MYLRTAAALLALLCAGCATYTTPGGPARLGTLGPAGVIAASQPAPHFPTTVAMVRLQAPGYESRTADGSGSGAFSLVTTDELSAAALSKRLAGLPSVDKVISLDPEELPGKLDALDDLRLAAAKHQADILLIYTIDTSFSVKGKAVDPRGSIGLGSPPGADDYVMSTASAIFTDVRTGFLYGSTQASAKIAGLGESWKSADAVDGRRLEAERQAFEQLSAEVEKSWNGIATQYR